MIGLYYDIILVMYTTMRGEMMTEDVKWVFGIAVGLLVCAVCVPFVPFALALGAVGK